VEELGVDRELGPSSSEPSEFEFPTHLGVHQPHKQVFLRSGALSLHLHLWWMLTGGLREKKTAVEIFEIFDRQKVAIARSGRYAGFHSLQLAIHITSFADN